MCSNADFAQFAAIRTLLGIVHAIAKCGVGQTNLFLDIEAITEGNFEVLHWAPARVLKVFNMFFNTFKKLKCNILTGIYGP